MECSILVYALHVRYIVRESLFIVFRTERLFVVYKFTLRTEYCAGDKIEKN